MIRSAGAERAWVVVVAWDDESLARGFGAALDRGEARSRTIAAGIAVDVSGFRRITSTTLEVLIHVGRRYRGRLVFVGANPAQTRVLSGAGLTVSFDNLQRDHSIRSPT